MDKPLRHCCTTLWNWVSMSLFVGSLAFEDTGVNLLFDQRLGIIIGSLLSGIFRFA